MDSKAFDTIRKYLSGLQINYLHEQCVFSSHNTPLFYTQCTNTAKQIQLNNNHLNSD